MIKVCYGLCVSVGEVFFLEPDSLRASVWGCRATRSPGGRQSAAQVHPQLSSGPALSPGRTWAHHQHEEARSSK